MLHHLHSPVVHSDLTPAFLFIEAFRESMVPIQPESLCTSVRLILPDNLRDHERQYRDGQYALTPNCLISSLSP